MDWLWYGDNNLSDDEFGEEADRLAELKFDIDESNKIMKAQDIYWMISEWSHKNGLPFFQDRNSMSKFIDYLIPDN